MPRFVKIPLLFLFIGSLLGIFLRWQFISPTPGINYIYFLHAHSHIMFLGWIFNVLFIGFTLNHIPKSEQRPFQTIFVVLQVLVVGMLISFPLQGYGFFSILFSTLHTATAIVYVVKFFTRTRHLTSASAWYARTGLLFFTLSTAGPFSLGYLMAAGLGQSQWYHFSIYFYLHFQYNGFFLFGILSLFFTLLEKRHIGFSVGSAKKAGMIFAGACVPAYLLSVLWATPGLAYNLMGGIAALIQVFGFAILATLIVKNAEEIAFNFRRSSVLFLCIALIAFAIKLSLQLVSAWPTVAQLAYELRPVVIAYLHLVLVGVISLFLLVWYVESGYVNERGSKNVIFLFIVSFSGMEFCLVLYPWWGQVFGSTFPPAATVTFVFSAGLFVSSLLFLVWARVKPDKSQDSC